MTKVIITLTNGKIITKEFNEPSLKDHMNCLRAIEYFNGAMDCATKDVVAKIEYLTKDVKPIVFIPEECLPHKPILIW